jgi:cell division protein FtsQ
LEPSKNRPRYSKPVPKARGKKAKPKAKPIIKKVKGTSKPSLKNLKVSASSRRARVREVRRFTKESQVKKIFFRSILGALLALVLFVLSTMFTPILAVNKITVIGEDKVPEAKIQAALKGYIGKPLPMISSENVAQDLARFKLIESIAVVSQPPHELRVKIVERTPISIVVKDGVAFLYDPSGIRLGVATGYEKLPTIIITGDPKTSKNYTQAIDVLLALPGTLLEKIEFIQAKTRDNVTMRLRGNAKQTIIWGDSSQAALKSRVLKVLLYKTPSRIPATFDVSSPLTPSVIR